MFPPVYKLYWRDDFTSSEPREEAHHNKHIHDEHVLTSNLFVMYVLIMMSFFARLWTREVVNTTCELAGTCYTLTNKLEVRTAREALANQRPIFS